MNSVISLTRGYRFQWEPAQESHVLLYPEGMVKLSSTASAILAHCDGENTLEQIIATLQAQFPGADLHDDVVEFLQEAIERGWVASS